MARMMTALCIRFWPEYEFAANAIRSGKYGRVNAMMLRRVSPTPTWSWKGWLADPKLSGGAALDLHLHDTDFVCYLFGKPERVTSTGFPGGGAGINSIVTIYHYADGPSVTAEGGWTYQSSYPFSMQYVIQCEKATLDFSSSNTPALSVYHQSGRVSHPKVSARTGWEQELRYFVSCVRKAQKPERVALDSVIDGIRVVEAERRSVASGRTVRVR